MFKYFKCEYRDENDINYLRWVLSLVRETDVKQ